LRYERSFALLNRQTGLHLAQITAIGQLALHDRLDVPALEDRGRRVWVTHSHAYFRLRLDGRLLGPQHEVQVATVSCTKLLRIDGRVALFDLIVGWLRNSL